MLLEGALAAKLNTKDPRDTRYNQLPEMMRDRRISGLEDALGKSKERNELLRGQVELTQGHYRDLPGEPTTGLPIVISFRADETLTSFFTNPGNSIGMLRCKRTGAGCTSLAEREVSQGPIRQMDTQTPTYTAGEALRSTLTAMNPDLGPLSRSR